MKYFIAFLILLSIIVSGCQKVPADQTNDGKLKVLVSILPQKYFVERIAGDKVNVIVLLPPGAFPVTFEPTPKTFTDIADAKIYFKVGHPKFALEVNWADKILEANKNLKTINLSDPSDFSDKNLDPHIWVAPGTVKKQLAKLTEALSTEMPENKDFFNKNKEKFTSEIDELILQINEKLKTVKNKKFLVLHPAWGYFAQEFGLEQVAIEEHGHESGHHNIKEIVELAKKNDIKVVFSQIQYSGKEADTVAREIGGQVIKIDPLAENWLDNLKLVADTLVKHMQ